MPLSRNKPGDVRKPLEPLEAARRDASFYRKPGRAEVDHIVMTDGFSGCGNVVLYVEGCMDAENVPENDRCMRRGCKERWPPFKKGKT